MHDPVCMKTGIYTGMHQIYYREVGIDTGIKWNLWNDTGIYRMYRNLGLPESKTVKTESAAVYGIYGTYRSTACTGVYTGI